MPYGSGTMTSGAGKKPDMPKGLVFIPTRQGMFGIRHADSMPLDMAHARAVLMQYMQTGKIPKGYEVYNPSKDGTSPQPAGDNLMGLLQKMLGGGSAPVA